MNGTEKRLITRFRENKGGGFLAEEDPVAVEKRLRVLVNGRELFKLYCSPMMIRELVTGFIMTEGLLKGGFCTERMSIEYGDEITVDVPADETPELGGGATITSGCGGGITFERYGDEAATGFEGIRGEDLKALFMKFQQASTLYRLTGCVHSAALSDGEHILSLAEDVGRHNAVDKIIGHAILENIRLDDKIMLSSGRLSSEIAGKCARWKIPVLASRTAPTSRAVDIAQKAGITVVGFLRGRGYNIYTHPERIFL